MTYLDHNAGTPLHPDVAAFLADAYRREPPGNPSSVHAAGRAARARLDEARARAGRVLGRPAREVLFTASGTEACATAVLGLGAGGTLVTAAIEHPAVLLAAERRGSRVVQLLPGSDGRMAVETFAEALEAGDVTACALQAANNETGVLQPVAGVLEVTRRRGVPLFVDAVQMPGREAAVVEAEAVAYSAHKFGGPAGVGLLVAGRSVQLEALIPGHQEGGRRGGTPPVVLCEAAALALELAERERGLEAARLRRLRDGFEETLRSGMSGVRVNGAGVPRLCNTSNVCFPVGDGEALLIRLDLAGVAVSLGSACASGTMRPSPVLRAMGLTEAEARRSLRFSFGRDTTDADVLALTTRLL